MHELRLRIQGRVQGVGFRYFVLVEATRLELGGCVRNLPDGAVEVIAQGDRVVLERLVDRVRQGPPGATITGLDATWAEATRRDSTFRIL